LRVAPGRVRPASSPAPLPATQADSSLTATQPV
jgi:hypothetical protein